MTTRQRNNRTPRLPTGWSIAAAASAVIALAGCEPSAENESAGRGASTTPEARQPAAQESVVHTAEGTVNSIDRAAGTVNISHSPIASASWPAMTMSFKLADANAVEDVAAGQRVEFEFTIEGGMSATVTRIAPTE